MADYSGAYESTYASVSTTDLPKAEVDQSIYGATTELENQITRLGSLINELDEKANRHITPKPEALNVPSLPDLEQGTTDAARRQWSNANDVRRLCNRLESLVYRLDLL